MNLTKALLGTIIKYPVSSVEIDEHSGDIRTKKMGYFYADRENFRDVQEATGTMGKRHPLSFLLEAADDISYRTADIEDGVKKGCLSYETLLRELGEYKREEQGEAYRRVVSWMEDKYRRALEKGYGRPDLYAVQNWIVSVQGQLLGSATESFAAHYEAIMAGEYGADLLTGTEMGLLAKALGSIAFRHVFQERPILQLEIGAQRIFEFLLERFVDAVIPYDTELPMTQVQEKLVALIRKTTGEFIKYVLRERTRQRSSISGSAGDGLYLRHDRQLCQGYVSGVKWNLYDSLRKGCGYCWISVLTAFLRTWRIFGGGGRSSEGRVRTAGIIQNPEQGDQ